MSWNVYRHNVQLEQLFSFLAAKNLDIICVQEMPASQLHLLKKYFPQYSSVLGKEFMYRKKKKESVFTYNVILTRLPLLASSQIAHKKHKRFPFLYQHFRQYKEIFIEAAHAKVQAGNKEIDIVCDHLECVASPAFRERQFKHVLAQVTATNLVYCADVNTFAHPSFNIFIAWLYGFPLYNLWTHERKTFARLVQKHSLQHPFEKIRTFATMPFSLDCIVVSKKLQIKRKKRIAERYGSDHYALFLELE